MGKTKKQNKNKRYNECKICNGTEEIEEVNSKNIGYFMKRCKTCLLILYWEPIKHENKFTKDQQKKNAKNVLKWFES